MLAMRHPAGVCTMRNVSTPQCDHVSFTYRSYGSQTVAVRPAIRASPS